MNETTKDRRPRQEELNEIKGRVAKMRATLEGAGLQGSSGATTGTKLVRYFTKISGVTPQEMTVAQWDAAFATLDVLISDDAAKAVKTVNETIGFTEEMLEEEAMIAKQRRAEIEEASRKEQDEQRKQRDEERKQRDERAGPHSPRIKELAAKFLREIEAEGFEGYAIVGVPNRMIESKFEEHLENCKDCDDDNGPSCDEGFTAMFEDDGFDNVFVYRTRYAGETADYAGLAFDLGGDGRDGMYPFTGDLLDAAEPYRPLTDHPQSEAA